MSDDSSGAAPDRRASWVALRTLRQRPAVVGRTEQGSTVYEIGSVRMVLPSGASHFKRLVPCSKCGREQTGTPVLVPDDLDRSPNPVICDRCVRSSNPPHPVAAPAPAPAPRPAVPAAPEAPAPPDPELHGRLAALEAQLAELTSRVTPVDEDEVLRRLSEEVAGVLGERDGHIAALSASLEEIRAELGGLNESNLASAQLPGEVNGRIDELAAQVQSLGPAVAEHLGRLRSELESLGQGSASLAGLEELRVEVTQLRETVAGTSGTVGDLHRALADGQAALDEKVRELAAGLDALPRADPEAVPAQALADLWASLAAAIDAGDRQLRGALTEELVLLRSEFASIRERAELESRGLATSQAGMEELRDQVSQLREIVTATSEAIAEPVRDLVAVRSDIQEIVGFNRALADAQAELGEKVRELAAVPTADHEAVDPQALVDLRYEIAALRDRSEIGTVEQGPELSEVLAGLEDLREQVRHLQKSAANTLVGAAIDTGDRQLHDTLTEGLGLLRAEIATVRDESAAVTALLEGQHQELRERMHDIAQETLMAVGEPLRDLVKAREDFERRLEALRQDALERHRRLEALNASADARDARLHALEQTLHSLPQGAEARPRPHPQRRPGPGLLESLEQQLRQAEDRLGKL